MPVLPKGLGLDDVPVQCEGLLPLSPGPGERLRFPHRGMVRICPCGSHRHEGRETREEAEERRSHRPAKERGPMKKKTVEVKRGKTAAKGKPARKPAPAAGKHARPEAARNQGKAAPPGAFLLYGLLRGREHPADTDGCPEPFPPPRHHHGGVYRAAYAHTDHEGSPPPRPDAPDGRGARKAVPVRRRRGVRRVPGSPVVVPDVSRGDGTSARTRGGGASTGVLPLRGRLLQRPHRA